MPTTQSPSGRITAPVLEPNRTLLCRSCQRELRPLAHFCDACGHDVSDSIDGMAPLRAVGDSLSPSGSDIGPPPAASAWVSDLCEWRVLSDDATRLNRNLIQYAASIGALLGIGAGSGGIFALADAVSSAGSQTLPSAIVAFVGASGVFIFVFGVGLLFLLVRAFRGRTRIEREADEHLRRLIYQKPDQFLPASG